MEVVGGCKTLIGCSPQVSGRRSMSAREYTARRRIQPAAQPSASQGTHNGNVIKICGITNVDDAAKATELGANLIGMILWPHAKRSISVEQAREISSLVTKQGAAAVAVFVNENAQEITRVCDQAGIHIAQLHGDGSRAAIVDLPKDLKTVYVMNVDESGNVCCTPPPRVADWILLDSMQGGSGKTLNWENLRVNWEIMSECGWILAGGLNPDNVVEAITVATPTGVDVSSGVCGPDGLRKDVKLMEEFIQRAKIRFDEEKL